ncbi:type II toxin-antitoxin system Phd/YefM family antitoxin [Pseudonocardia acaciae]|uniref:type II toxin-antitoxin system Phd/YefM family antitoxin n=1 Tax=Pseudonocardia acaciae TaxID=551276 RepID=UPI000491F651|nr:type II toxin-antitoxin system prevent-host-death family antitoxin [Pseudonocardia acaciae]
MEKQVNVYEAKSQLSKLLEQVENGDEIVIARNGRPIAKLVPLQRLTSPRTPGAWKGKGWIADDFDDPGGEYDEVIDAWYRKLDADPA